MEKKFSTRFIGEAISVHHDRSPALEKIPGPPDSVCRILIRLIWEGRTYRIVEVLSEWHDYRHRGRTATFYRKERGSFRAKAAERRGSWGVGRDYYRVRTDTGAVFDLYYDRAPRGSKHRIQLPPHPRAAAAHRRGCADFRRRNGFLLLLAHQGH